MKKLILFALLLVPAAVFGQTAGELFADVPESVIGTAKDSRAKAILTTHDGFITFRLSNAVHGELKILSQSKGETFFGLSKRNCDESVLKFWKVKGGVWKDVTNDVVKPLSPKDFVNILKVSPVTVTKLGEDFSVSVFYQFTAESTDLNLYARKQSSCDVAGTVYQYTFNGKKYSIKK